MTAVSQAQSRRPKTTLSTTPPPHARGAISRVALVGILTLIEALLILAVVANSLGLGAEGSQGVGRITRRLPARCRLVRRLSDCCPRSRRCQGEGCSSILRPGRAAHPPD